MSNTRFRWRDQYDTDRDELEGQLTATEIPGDSLTEQSHTAAADLNLALKRMGIKDNARIPAESSVTDPRYYGDFDTSLDLQNALETTREAQQRFNNLPADIRSRFNNDPVQLFRFVNDPNNAEKSVEMGLLKRWDPPKTAAEQAPAASTDTQKA